MITRLPKWILWGGAVLAFSVTACAAALMGFTNLSVSHVTGNVSLFSAAIAHLDSRSILYRCLAAAVFFGRAVLSSFVIGQRSLKLGRYGGALYINGTIIDELLVISAA